MNLKDEIVRIEQAQQDVHAYVATMHKLSERENVVAAKFAVAGMVVGAFLFGAGTVFVKLMG